MGTLALFRKVQSYLQSSLHSCPVGWVSHEYSRRAAPFHIGSALFAIFFAPCLSLLCFLEASPSSNISFSSNFPQSWQEWTSKKLSQSSERISIIDLYLVHTNSFLSRRESHERFFLLSSFPVVRILFNLVSQRVINPTSRCCRCWVDRRTLRSTLSSVAFLVFFSFILPRMRSCRWVGRVG